MKPNKLHNDQNQIEESNNACHSDQEIEVAFVGIREFEEMIVNSVSKAHDNHSLEQQEEETHNEGKVPVYFEKPIWDEQHQDESGQHKREFGYPAAIMEVSGTFSSRDDDQQDQDVEKHEYEGHTEDG